MTLRPLAKEWSRIKKEMEEASMTPLDIDLVRLAFFSGAGCALCEIGSKDALSLMREEMLEFEVELMGDEPAKQTILSGG